MKKRQANLDLLRILGMLLIIFLHTIDHSGVLENAQKGTWMYVYIYYGYMLAQVCVNVFVLISGYFLVRSKFRFGKLVSLWAETVFYALTIRILFMATGQQEFSIVSLVSCLFPFITGRYWFITIYVGLYLLSPFLNLAIRAMSKKQLGWLNVLLFLLFSVWSSLHPSMAGMNSGGGWGLAWFVVLYLAAAWFRLYYQPTYKSGRAWLAFFGLPAIVVGLLMFSQTLGIGMVETVVRNWYRYDGVPAYIASLSLMAALLNTRIPEGWLSKLLVKVSPLTFAVYLIHMHGNMESWLWSVLKLPEKMAYWYFPLLQIGVTVGIFAACCVIEYGRKTVSHGIVKSKMAQKLSYKSRETWYKTRAKVERKVDSWLA